MFRGLFFARMLCHAGPVPAYLFSSLFFGLSHWSSELGLSKVVASVCAGGIFAGAYHATGRLWVPVLLHIMCNSLVSYSYWCLSPVTDPALLPQIASSDQDQRHTAARELRVARIRSFLSSASWAEPVLKACAPVFVADPQGYVDKHFKATPKLEAEVTLRHTSLEACFSQQILLVPLF